MSTVPRSPHQLSALWSPPIPKNGIITAYTVYCNTSASQAYPEQLIGPNVATPRSVVNGTTLGATITGLNPYTNYDCYITANTSVGEGSLSAVTTARTDESCECIICLQHIRLRLASAVSVHVVVVVTMITTLQCTSNNFTVYFLNNR